MAAANDEPIPCGYDCDAFLTQPDDEYICTVCQSVVREPVLTRCGHRFCKDCLERWWQSQESARCPNCNTEALDRDKDVFPDKPSGRKISSFRVKCPNRPCQWTGELGDVENHRRTCLIEIIQCPNKNCTFSYARFVMKDHESGCDWRILACTYCGDKYPRRSETEHHKCCCKFPLNCKLSCGKNIPRGEMDVHCKDICPLTVISCEYQDLGCIAKIRRQDLNNHLNDSIGLHLKLSGLKIINLQQKFETKQQNLEIQQQKVDIQQQKLENQQQKLENQQQKLENQQQKLDNQQQKLENKQQKLENQQQKIELLHQMLENQQLKLENQQQELENQQQKLENQQQKLENQQQKIELLHQMLENQQKELDQYRD